MIRALKRQNKLGFRLITRFAISAIIAATLGVSPALAEDLTTGTASLSAITSTDQAASGGQFDSEFSDLFSSWEALDDGGLISHTGDIIPAPRASVSVPSRMPVEGVTLTSGYGMRNHPILRKRARHNGVDLAAARGTPVYATADGLIGKAQRFSSYGNYVQIEHGGELQTRYAHLSSYTVRAGDMVEKGDLIGYVGSTGRSTGPHLHYEVRVAGEAVDPVPYMFTDLALAAEGEGGVGGPE